MGLAHEVSVWWPVDESELPQGASGFRLLWGRIARRGRQWPRLAAQFMPDVLHLYADDSGSRLPDRKDDRPPNRNWFGLGGVLIEDTDEDAFKERYDRFVANWPEIRGKPLHSVKIRGKAGNFAWLGTDDVKRQAFLDELTEFICGSPVLCIAAVIDRSGYFAKYEGLYTPEERWSLCKTAFAILVERAVKYAMDKSKRLRVFVERTNKVTDRSMKKYYEELRTGGMPFDTGNMAAYAPVTAKEFDDILHEFRTATKESRLMQLADLCLYPVCLYPYEPSNRAFLDLHKAGKLINCVLRPEDVGAQGIKFSRFDVKPVSIPPWTRL